jgi:hypothetical protein
MQHSEVYKKRKARVSQWYESARLGIFYHWGMFTGGGMTSDNENYVPLTYKTIEELEAAAPEPDELATNMVSTAVRFGAKYLNITCLHSCAGYCVIFPSKLDGFLLKTRFDYLGAIIDESVRNQIKPMIYMPMENLSWNAKGGPYLKEDCRDMKGFCGLLELLIDELAERYGDKIGGIWLDGGVTEEFKDFPKHIHSRLPNAIVVVNNNMLDVNDVDYGTAEFLEDEPNPIYNRPSALPTRLDDFIEDIPNCCSWWHWKDPGRFAHGVRQKEAPYLEDNTFMVKQMLSSIGQRVRWNYTIGIPVAINGKIPEKYNPMFDKMERFMEWASEAVYDTFGGLHSNVKPGWINDDGFCSVTVSNKINDCCYVLVTTAPKTNCAKFFTNGLEPVCVSDLRTGETIEFDMSGGMGIQLSDQDWSDVDKYGAKVFKVEFSCLEELPPAI